jgi:hypothetical protein
MRAARSATALLAAAAVVAASTASFPFTVQVGNPAYVLYPNASGIACLPDMSTVVINVSSTTLRGYTCVGEEKSGTWLFINGSSLSAVDPDGGFVNEVLSDAADIEGMVVDPGNSSVVYGLMHKEYGWKVGPTYFYYGVIMLQTSVDSGLSFTAVPNTGNVNDSIVVQSIGPANPGQPANTGTGPNWAVYNPSDGFVYLFYQDAFAVDAQGAFTRAYCVARSPLAGGLVRGTWLKYFNGAWVGDGMAGNASALPNLPGAKVVWLNSTRVWLAVGYTGLLAVSSDLVTWTPVPSQLFPPIPTGQQHPVHFVFPNAVYYTSLIPGYGGTTYYEKEDSLFLYFLFAAANNVSAVGPGTRALAAAQLTLAPNPPAAAPFTVLSLCQYVKKQNSSSSGGSGGSSAGPVAHHPPSIQPTRRARDEWRRPSEVAAAVGGPVTDTWDTAWPVDQRAYDYAFFLGFVFATPEDWTLSPLVPLIDCYFISTEDHFTARLGECQPPNYVALLGGLGYILADNATAVPGYDPLPLWRCYDEANENHYLAPLYGCQPTDKDPTLLGYALWQND